MNTEISYDELHKLFAYDPESGLLIRRITLNCRSMRGDIVGASQGNYLQVWIYGKKYLVHRIIYCMHHGYWTKNNIDHINQNKLDNRIENLRETNQTNNSKNAKQSSNNKSGVTGVSWNKTSKKWKAQIGINNKVISLGNYKDFNQAVIIRYQAELKYGYDQYNTNSSAQQYLIENVLPKL